MTKGSGKEKGRGSQNPFERLWEWIANQDYKVYLVTVGSVVLVLILERGHPIIQEFLGNLFDVVKEFFLKAPLEMVAEAWRRTDGQHNEEAVETVNMNLVIDIDGHDSTSL